MNRRLVIFGAVLLVLMGLGGFLVYEYRAALRDWTYQASRPSLPVAEPYVASSPSSTIGNVISTSTKPSGTFASEKLLDVPFTSQAPHANWEDPYQEACEEASIIMVAAYYKGERGALQPDEADRRILQLIDREESKYGYGQDVTAQQVVELIEGEFSDLRARVFPIKTASDIVSYVAKGIPVIVPADGKVLPNPNFRNGGPVYHMLVVIGYTGSEFITNDPGTRLGKEFIYTYDQLLSSIHDWNGGDVRNGARVGVAVEKVE